MEFLFLFTYMSFLTLIQISRQNQNGCFSNYVNKKVDSNKPNHTNIMLAKKLLAIKFLIFGTNLIRSMYVRTLIIKLVQKLMKICDSEFGKLFSEQWIDKCSHEGKYKKWFHHSFLKSPHVQKKNKHETQADKKGADPNS